MIDKLKGTVPYVFRILKHMDRAFLDLVLDQPYGDDGQTVVDQNRVLHAFRERRFDALMNGNVVPVQVFVKQGARSAAAFPHDEVKAFQIRRRKGIPGGEGVLGAVSRWLKDCLKFKYSIEANNVDGRHSVPNALVLRILDNTLYL